MNKFSFALCAIFIAIFSNFAFSKTILELDVKGTINPGVGSYVDNAVKDANKSAGEISAILIKLDTPGGLLSSTRSIIQSMSESNVPVIIYVTPAGASATSAGAIISIGAHFVVMAPGTNLGAAHPVDGSGQDIAGDMRKKIENDTSAFVRSLAKLRGRNEQKSIEVVTKSLSFSADEALQEGLIDAVAGSREELLTKLDGKIVNVKSGLTKFVAKDSTFKTYKMSTGQNFLHLISDPNISYGLMALGGLGIYVELTTPGVVIPGVVGVISLILAFVSLQTLPVNYGGVALILVSLVLFILEAFVASYGALTIGGIVSMIIGTVFLIDKGWADLGVSLWVSMPIALAIGSIVAMIGFLLVKRRKEMKKEVTGFETYIGEIHEVHLDSENGNSIGKVYIRGETWDFVSSDKLAVGDKVFVSSVNSYKLFVTKK